MTKTIFYALLANLIVTPVFAHEFVATITKINDGDTITALVNNETTKIRLLDVDCYETSRNKHAPFQHKLYNLSYNEIFKLGKHSKEKLNALLKDHKYIRVKWEKRDSFGRILGKVYMDDIKSVGVIDVNKYMLNHGGCNKYVPSSVLKKSKEKK